MITRSCANRETSAHNGGGNPVLSKFYILYKISKKGGDLMFGYIYITTNLINNKRYIGKREWKDELNINSDNYLGSGKILKQSFQKYGKENFSKKVVWVCYTEEELCEKEKEYINKYDATNSNEFYNIHEGGKGGNTRKGYTKEEMELFKIKMKSARKNYRHSEETKIKIKNTWKNKENHMKLPKYRKMFSEKFKGENNPMYGRKMTERTKQKLYESHNGFFAYNKGKMMTEDQKIKISTSLKNAWQNKEVRNKWIKSKYGRVNSDETKKKMSESAYKRYGTFPLDDSTIIFRCNYNWSILEIFNGITEYYSRYKTKTCRNLRNAIKNKSKFKNSYWYVEFNSQSTIENTSFDGSE